MGDDKYCKKVPIEMFKGIFIYFSVKHNSFTSLGSNRMGKIISKTKTIGILWYMISLLLILSPSNDETYKNNNGP